MHSPIAGTVIALALMLPGCATPEQKLAAASNVSTVDDQFNPHRQYRTGAIKSSFNESVAVGNYETQLMAEVDRKTGASGAGLQFTIRYTANLQRKYQEARNANAENLAVHSVVHHASDCSKKLGSCTYLEAVIIDLPVAGLRSAGNQGYPIKLFPKIGQGIELAIPKSLITSLFDGVDAGEKHVAAAQQMP